MENVAALIGAKAADKELELLFDLEAYLPRQLNGDPLRLGQVIRLRALGLPSAPLPVLVTAYGRAEVIEEAHEAGIDHTLVKPVSPSQLHDVALHALRGDVVWTGTARDRSSATEGLDLSSIQGAHILLVEDNELGQQVATELLRDAGFRVDLAENGRIAVDKRDFYEKIIRGFIRGEQAKAPDTIRLFLQDGAVKGAERAAHSLKGVAGTLGADELHRRAQTLEAALRDGTESKTPFAEVEAELLRLLEAIGQALGADSEPVPAADFDMAGIAGALDAFAPVADELKAST